MHLLRECFFVFKFWPDQFQTFFLFQFWHWISHWHLPLAGHYLEAFISLSSAMFLKANTKIEHKDRLSNTLSHKPKSHHNVKASIVTVASQCRFSFPKISSVQDCCTQLGELIATPGQVDAAVYLFLNPCDWHLTHFRSCWKSSTSRYLVNNRLKQHFCSN